MSLVVTHHSLILSRDAHPPLAKTPSAISWQLVALMSTENVGHIARRYASIDLHYSFVASQLVCYVVIGRTSLASSLLFAQAAKTAKKYNLSCSLKSLSFLDVLSV